MVLLIRPQYDSAFALTLKHVHVDLLNIFFCLAIDVVLFSLSLPSPIIHHVHVYQEAICSLLTSASEALGPSWVSRRYSKTDTSKQTL